MRGLKQAWYGTAVAAGMLASALAVFLPACARGEVTYVSSTSFADAGGKTDLGRDVAVLSNGDIIVLGITAPDGNASEYWLGKFDKNTSVLISSVSLEVPNPLDKFVGRIAVDSGDNIWMVGASTTSGTGSDIFLQKFNSSFQPQVQKIVNGDGALHDVGWDIVIGGIDDIYVAGAMGKNANGKDLWVGRYDQFGLFLASRTFDGGANGEDEFQSIARDSQGNIYAAGTFWNGGASDSVVAKFDSGLNLLGMHKQGFAGTDEDLYAVGVGQDGKIYAAGHAAFSAFNGDGMFVRYSSTVGYEAHVTVADPNGFFDRFYDMKIGPLGDLWAVGTVALFPGLQTTAASWIVQYAPNLSLVSSRTFTSPGSFNDAFYGLAFDKNSDLVAAGAIFGDANEKNTDIVLARYDAETAPFTFAGEAESTSRLHWTWGLIPGATGYAVKTTTGGVVAGPFSAATTFYFEGGMSTNTFRARHLAAYRTSGEVLSGGVTAYTLATDVTGYAFTEVFASSASLVWAAGGNPAGTRYEVVWSTDNFATSLSTPVPLALGFTANATGFSGLQNVTTFYTKLRAYNGDGIPAAYSPVISTWTIPLTPNAPLIDPLPKVHGASSGTINWSWFHSSPPLPDGFEVIAATGGSLSGPLGAHVTYYTQIGLGPNATFQALIKAFNRSGKAESGIRLVYTLADIPTNPAFHAVNITSVTIAWDTGSNPAGTRYQISQSFDNFATVFSTPISIVDNYQTNVATLSVNIINETSHYFRIQALNGDGLPSGFSTVISTFTRPNRPNPPSFRPFPESTGLSTGSIHWKWSHAQPPTINGFRVVASTGGPISPDIKDGTSDYIQTGLTPNTTFTARVVAFNVSDSSASAEMTLSTLANPPTGFAIDVSEVHITSVGVTWGSNGNPGPTRYEITASTTNDFNLPITTSIALAAGLTGNTTFAPGLTGDTTWFLRIRGYNANGIATLFASTVSVLTRPPEPNVPVFLSSETVALSTSDIQWGWNHFTPPVIDGFRVEAASGGLISPVLTETETRFIQRGLPPNTTFTAVVRAINVSGATPSAAATVYTLARPPTSIGNWNSEVHISSVALAWDADGNPNDTRWEVLQSTDDFADPVLTSTPIALASAHVATTAFVFGLQADTTYYWRVRAYNGDGIETALSASTRALTRPEAPNAPAISAFPESVGYSTTAIKWAWTHVSPPAFDGFRVRSSTDGLLTANDLTADTTFFIQGGLTPNTSHTVYVKAFNVSAGSSSQQATRYTLARPVVNTQLTQLFVSSLSLTWSTNGNPPGTLYELYRSTPDQNFQVVLSTTANLVYDTLTDESTYFYFVKAVNGDGVRASSDVIVSTAVLGFAPEPPRNLRASAQADGSVLLEWDPSPSGFTVRYNVYWDQGAGGGVDYGVFLTTLAAPATGYTTPLLGNGTYFFGLRARSLLKDDGNTDVVASVVVIATQNAPVPWVQTRVAAPKSGKRIWGNRVTLEAERFRGDATDLREVVFQYRTLVTTAAWFDVPAVAFNNPDRAAPYSVHWNVTGLPNAQYEVRAVAVNGGGDRDPAPPSVVLKVDSASPEVLANVSGQSVVAAETVYDALDNRVVLAQEGADRVVTVELPRGFLGTADPTTLNIETPPVLPPDVPRPYTGTGIAFTLSLANGTKALAQPVRIRANYRDDDGDGLIDGSLARVDNLKFFYYDPALGRWTATVPSSIDRTAKTVTMTTSHFSTFALFSPASTDLSGVVVYPVPWVPNDGVDDNGKPFFTVDPQSGIIFENLTQSSRIEVYTIAGELVWEKTLDNTSGKVQWDVTNLQGRDVASGGYIAVIRDTQTNEAVVKKIAVIR